jgi:hypothetical protein
VEGINFRNRRTPNGIKVKKLQLYVVARFGIHPTLCRKEEAPRSILARAKQFTCLGITVFAHLAAGLATAIQVLRCQDRERSCVVPSWELILQSEAARGSPLIRGTAGACRSRHVRAKTWPPETGDELSANMPPSGMKEKNVCSEEVGEDYADADGPNRKADCEGGDRRDLS